MGAGVSHLRVRHGLTVGRNGANRNVGFYADIVILIIQTSYRASPRGMAAHLRRIATDLFAESHHNVGIGPACGFYKANIASHRRLPHASSVVKQPAQAVLLIRRDAVKVKENLQVLGKQNRFRLGLRAAIVADSQTLGSTIKVNLQVRQKLKVGNSVAIP